MSKFLSIFLISHLLFSSLGLYTKLAPNSTAILFIDLQVGLFNGVEDIAPADFMNNIEALADIGSIFNLPVVLTTSKDTGPNGPIIPYITSKYPNVTVVRRPGEIDAFDNEDFV